MEIEPSLSLLKIPSVVSFKNCLKALLLKIELYLLLWYRKASYRPEHYNDPNSNRNTNLNGAMNAFVNRFANPVPSAYTTYLNITMNNEPHDNQNTNLNGATNVCGVQWLSSLLSCECLFCFYTMGWTEVKCLELIQVYQESAWKAITPSSPYIQWTKV